LLATEDPDLYPARSRTARSHQSARGSVALIGPTRSGKTVLAARGIRHWDGPVVAVSVKRDLYDATFDARTARGKVAMFDPGGSTGIPTARWSPLRNVTTVAGARRAARALSAAIPRTGQQGGDFWAKHAEGVVAAYFAVAGLAQLMPDVMEDRAPFTMQRLAGLVFRTIGVTDEDVNELLVAGLAEDRPLEVRLLANEAATTLAAVQSEDSKIRSSIYVTARLALEAWTEPAIAHSASDDPRPTYNALSPASQPAPFVDLDWLMGSADDGSANTLYLSASDTEFARLAPVLGGLLGDLREQIHTNDIAGHRLAKPLLIVIDEAGQLELDWLPAEVSTIAGLGAILVTCWQSRAQINHRYGTLADAVLGGHRTKVFFNGIDDPTTLDYVTSVAGTTTVPNRGWSTDLHGGHRSISQTDHNANLIPSHLLRHLGRGEALVLHGGIPPFRITNSS
jgi:type IV secretion system protein VirD4